MPGVRLFASTAMILLLSAAAGGALAQPNSGPDIDAAAPAPGAANVAAPTASATPTEGEPGQTSAKQTGSADETVAPAAAAKPDESIDQPAAAAATPAVATPASTPNPDESIEGPAAPAIQRFRPRSRNPPPRPVRMLSRPPRLSRRPRQRRVSPRRHRLPTPSSRPMLQSPNNCAISPTADSTASSAAKRKGRPSMRSIPPAIMRRCGSPSARRMRAVRRR